MVTAIKGNATSTFGGNIDVPQIITDAPAFSAYLSTNQTVTASTWTKIQIDTEEFDTNSNYDNTTNYRFTPTVAGYYQFNCVGRFGATSGASREIISVYKNGSEFSRGTDFIINGNNILSNSQHTHAGLIYLNGTTDYVELYGYIIGAGTISFINDGDRAYSCRFEGYLARAV